MKSFIQEHDHLFPNNDLGCDGTDKNYEEKQQSATSKKVTEVAQDSMHKVLIAKSSGSEFQWRYRFDGDLSWIIADEKDSVLIIEKTKIGTYEV